MKTWVRLAITLALCALLLVYVVDVRDVLATLARCDPLWALVAIAALTLDRVLMCVKWGMLLRIRGYRLSLARRMMVYCSAMMWGMALPSTVGADGLRMWLVRRFGVRVDDALATILVERAIGFVSALGMALLGLLILRLWLPDARAYDYIVGFGSAGILLGVCALVYSFSDHASHMLRRAVPKRWASHKIVTLLLSLHDAYRSLAGDKARIAGFSVLTVLEQMLTAACYGLVAVALGVTFNVLFLLAAVPLAILVSRLPISIDGIGIYEGIFVAIMALSGVAAADALAISIATRAFQIVVWLPWWAMMAAQTQAIAPPAMREADSR